LSIYSINIINKHNIKILKTVIQGSFKSYAQTEVKIIYLDFQSQLVFNFFKL